MARSRPYERRVKRVDLPMQILGRLLIAIVKFAQRDQRRDRSSRVALRAYRANGIRYRPEEWFQRSLTPTDRRAMSRATAYLEEQGLLVRFTEPKRDRVAYVRPTASGLLRGLDDGGVEVDLAALAQSLQHTCWGRDLAEMLRTEPMPKLSWSTE